VQRLSVINPIIIAVVVVDAYSMSLLLDLLTYDNDSFGYDECIGELELWWQIGVSPEHLLENKPESIVFIHESAENVLLEALGLEYD
jgi:hypothetical protein